MARLLIVSNRLPATVRLDRGEPAITHSAGGLATGLRRVHEARDSPWIGWPGDVSRLDSIQREQIDRRLQESRLVPVYLTQSESLVTTKASQMASGGPCLIT